MNHNEFVSHPIYVNYESSSDETVTHLYIDNEK